MEQDQTVTVSLSVDMLRALGRAAETAGCSPSDYLRAVLRSALDRSPARLRPEDEVICQAIHIARDWLDLQRRLRASGYVLRRAPEGGLAVHSWPLDRPIMRLGDLGHSLAALVLKFRAPFPGDLRATAGLFAAPSSGPETDRPARLPAPPAPSHAA
ncbi:MAG: hypothetical protein KDE03_02445 [Rhodobacteraceae bacterium]|nr:hypothetical protein [Paracoccaceae bacterium]